MRITQNSPHIPGNDQVGDRFGSVVAVADIDSDGYADILVGAVGEDASSGRVTIIRGNHDGYAREGNVPFDPSSPFVAGGPTPGAEFGSTITALQLTADNRIDVAVAAKGAHAADDRITVMEGNRGIFAPDETRIYTLSGASRQVSARRGGRIRLAADATG